MDIEICSLKFVLSYILNEKLYLTVNFHTQRSGLFSLFLVRKIFRPMRIVNNVFSRETKRSRTIGSLHDLIT